MNLEDTSTISLLTAISANTESIAELQNHVGAVLDTVRAVQNKTEAAHDELWGNEIVVNAREDRRRLDDVINRLSAADAKLNALNTEFDMVREFGNKIQDVQTDIVEKLTELSVRFVEHIEQESEERKLMAVMAEQIKETALQLKEVVIKTHYIEKGLIFAITIGVGAISAGVSWIISYMAR